MKLEERYKKEIVPQLKEKFKYKNNFEVPKIIKVVINVGFGRNAKEKEFVDNVIRDLTQIGGQKPIKTKAKKSISAFKIREGMIIGASVTLRGKKMYDFVDKLVNISFPRVRDFQGITDKSIDNKGNITVGFKEHTVFPEVKAENVENVFGLEVCVATNAKTKEEGFELLNLVGFPFKK